MIRKQREGEEGEAKGKKRRKEGRGVSPLFILQFNHG